MTIADPLCADCRFWQELPAGDPPESRPYVVEGMGTGLCRRHPPAGLRPASSAIRDTADAAMAAAWPITWNHDWCGEFTPAPAIRRSTV